MNTTLIRDETTIARAMSDFQRKPAAPLRYPLLTRIGDWSAGIHDQAFAHDGELDTPRLQALRHEFATRLEHERRDTLALIVCWTSGSPNCARARPRPNPRRLSPRSKVQLWNAQPSTTGR